MKKYITNKYTLTIFGVILFFLLWWILSATIGHGSRIFPDPWSTLSYVGVLLTKEGTYLDIAYSFERLILGFAIGLIIGLLLGVFVGNIKKSKYVFKPTISALKAVPTAAFIFLCLVLVGAKNTPIIIVSLISFPIIYESTLGGLTSIDESILMSLKIDSDNFIVNNLKIKLPLAAPYIIVGIMSSFALSFKIEIMSEVIAGSTSYGIGNAIKTAQQNDQSNLVPVFAYSFLALILMLIISLFASLINKKMQDKIK